MGWSPAVVFLLCSYIFNNKCYITHAQTGTKKMTPKQILVFFITVIWHLNQVGTDKVCVETRSCPLVIDIYYTHDSITINCILLHRVRPVRPECSLKVDSSSFPGSNVPENDPTSVSRIKPGGLLFGSSLEFQSTVTSFLCSHTAYLHQRTWTD